MIFVSTFVCARYDCRNIQEKEVLHIENLSNQMIKTLEPINSLNKRMSRFKNIISNAYSHTKEMKAIIDNIKNNSFSKIYKDIEKFKNRINNFYNIFKTLENLNKITLIRLNKPILHIQKPFYINSLKGYQGSINSPPVKNKKENIFKKCIYLLSEKIVSYILKKIFLKNTLKIAKDIKETVFSVERSTKNLKDILLITNNMSSFKVFLVVIGLITILISSIYLFNQISNLIKFILNIIYLIIVNFLLICFY